MAEKPRSELTESLRACRHALIGLGIGSALINVLYLTGSFYMLEIYDRVLPSRSVPTLVGLSILALCLFSFQAILDLLRSRIMVRIGRSLGSELSAQRLPNDHAACAFRCGRERWSAAAS